MGERGAKDKPKCRYWERRSLLWEGECEYFDHTVPYDRLHACGSLILREEQPHRSASCATAYTGTACPIRMHTKRVMFCAALEADGIVFATLG